MNIIVLLKDIDIYPDDAKMYDLMGKFENVKILTSTSNFDKDRYENIITIPSKKNLFDFSTKAYEFIKRNDFDLIQDTFYSSAFHIFSKKWREYLIALHVTNNIDWFVRTRKAKKNHHYDLHKLKSIMIDFNYIRKIKYHFVNNYQIKNDFIKYFGIDYDKIFVVKTPIDLDSFDDTNNGFEKEKKCFRFLFVGNIFNVKGVYDLINAASLLKKNYDKNFKIIFIGNVHPYEKSNLKKIIQETSLDANIQFLSFMSRDKLTNYYKTSNCFVFPSFHEGSPRVIREALAFKLPTICSDIPGNKIIDPNKEVLNFFRKGNINELFDLMRDVMSNYDEYLNKSMKKSDKILDKFNCYNVAKENIKIYRSILKKY